jgi:alpha-glucosidase
VVLPPVRPPAADLNWDNPEVREDFKTTLRFWADRGVDGYRVDVAHALAKDLSEPLRSKPSLYDSLGTDGNDPLFDRDEVHEIYAEWRQVFNSYDPPRTAVAEAFARSERRALYARPTGLGQAFNFDLLRSDFDADQFREVITFCLAEAAQVGSSSTWVLSNHDEVRHASRYALPTDVDLDEWLMSDGGLPLPRRDRRPPACPGGDLLMLALPGSSYLYQGEELGLHEVSDLPVSALQDPIWQRTLNTKKGRDGCRVPLPWTGEGESYGFGSGPSWLPQPAGFSAYAVTAQGRAARVHPGAVPGGPAGAAPAAGCRGARVAADRSSGGAALRPAGRLALRDQLRDRVGAGAGGSGAGQQRGADPRPAAGGSPPCGSPSGRRTEPVLSLHRLGPGSSRAVF